MSHRTLTRPLPGAAPRLLAIALPALVAVDYAGSTATAEASTSHTIRKLEQLDGSWWTVHDSENFGSDHLCS